MTDIRMRLYSYIVAVDDGFAPCVTRGLCSLACCKPKIRATASEGDWVLGTMPKDRGAGRVVYMMQVQRVLTFSEYWRNRLLRRRKDNIYAPVRAGGYKGYKQKRNYWHDHSNIRRDLGTDRVLLARRFAYFGAQAPQIPSGLVSLAARGQGHRTFGRGKNDSPQIQQKIKQLVRWAFARGRGKLGHPFDAPATHHGNCS